MAVLKRIKLGAFPAGEIPDPLRHSFLTFDRSPYDISGWTVLGFFVEGPEGYTPPSVLPLITNGPLGEVTHVWLEGEMTIPGPYTGIFWVQDSPTNPSVRLGSDLYVWDVEDAPGPTPPEVP